MIGVGQIGCSPNALAQNSPDGKTCVARINSANDLFNRKLIGLVDEFNNEQGDAKFIYVNAYGIFQDLINNPSAFGNFSQPSSCSQILLSRNLIPNFASNFSFELNSIHKILAIFYHVTLTVRTRATSEQNVIFFLFVLCILL